MAHRLIKQAIETYVPAVAEVVAIPAYSEVSYVKKAVTKTGGKAQSTIPVPVYGPVKDEYGRTSQGIIGYTAAPTSTYVVYEDVPVYTFHPGVPGIPGKDAVTLTDQQFGWNSGAQSVDSVDGDFQIHCAVDASVQGVLVGIQAAGGQSGSFNSVEHGILIASAQPVAVIERGVNKSTGALVAGQVFITISRAAGAVTYRIGETPIYTSAVMSSGPMVMSAVMYAGSDAVDDPRLSELTSLASTGEWGWGSGSGFYELRMRSSWGWNGHAAVNDGEVRMSFDVDISTKDEEFSSVLLELDAPVLVRASGFDDIDLASAAGVIPMSMQAMGISIDVGAVSLDLSTTMRASEYDYGETILLLDGMEVFALSDEQPAGVVTVGEIAFMGDYYFVDPVVYASLVSSLSVGSSFDLLMSMEADLADHLMLMDETSIALMIQALLENRIGIADASTRSARDVFDYVDSITGLAGQYDFSGTTFATNLVTGTVGRYAGFDFDGFCRVGMQSYGFRADGLYLLGAQNDNGSAIGTRVDFAAEDFGSVQSKRVGNIFMGLSTDGQVYVRTEEDGEQQMTYRAYQRKAEFRADMQRGRASRFWRLRLEVVEATHTELDNVEWVITPTGRRSS
jgi:hypothetical protein